MVEKKTAQKIDLSQPETLRKLDSDTLIGMVVRLAEQNRELSELLQSFLQEKYGKKTETFEDPDQLNLFSEADLQTDALANEKSAEADDDGKEDKSNEPKKPRRNRQNPRSSGLARVRVPVGTPMDSVCKCGASLVKINEKVVHSRYHYVPSVVCIQELVEDVLACPSCDETAVANSELIEQAEENTGFVEREKMEPLRLPADWQWIEKKVPADTQSKCDDLLGANIGDKASTMRRAVGRVIRCQASPALLSYVAISKFCDHLPLYRIERIFARHGADIARSTMCGWLAVLAALLRPIYDLMHEKLLASRIIKTDDTSVKVQVRKGKKKIKTGRMWVYIGDREHPFTLFHYTQGRARAGPKIFLKGFRGFLQGDCFSGNLAICAENGAIFVACNAHGRRYFKKALLNYKAKSSEALRFYRRLFRIERDAQELELKPQDIRLMREQESKPILDEFKLWLDREHLMALPKSAFGKAVFYALNNWEALNAYLLDGELAIDNNESEQQMKFLATGRKAWLFLGSDDGGESAEALMSITATCKRHNVEPFAYLTDVIETLMANPDVDLERLLPNNWQPKKR